MKAEGSGKQGAWRLRVETKQGRSESSESSEAAAADVSHPTIISILRVQSKNKNGKIYVTEYDLIVLIIVSVFFLFSPPFFLYIFGIIFIIELLRSRSEICFSV